MPLALLPDPLRPFVERREIVRPTAGDGDGGDGLAPELIRSWTSSGDAKRYRDYQARMALAYVGRSVLIVGEQTGEFAARLVELKGAGLERLVLTDRDQNWVDHLERRFRHVRGAEVLRLELPGVPDIQPVDTVIMVNVLGYIRYDVGVIEALAKVTQPGGRFVVWEAAFPKLLSEFDEVQANRLMRYEPETLRHSLWQGGLDVELSQAINLLGGLFNLIRPPKEFADPRLVRLYDRTVVPLSRRLDCKSLPFGQNVFAVATRPPAE
ncbi:class I SAM-dependent methyltransferase [Spirillospora sp. CA-142024]|uniref:class I SAM-dependent methyltransferase n=1 Tax=Spirillospora sp. CA-142024 TaxID=3240036 RepID=UPI003D8A67A2